MRLPATLLAIAVSAACSFPAAAQDSDTLMMGNINGDVSPVRPADIRFMHEFASCAVGGKTDILRRLPASRQSDQSLFNAAYWSTSCVEQSDKLRFSVRYFRGIVAEQLLERDFDLSSWRPRREPSRVYDTPTIDQLSDLSAETRSSVIRNEIGLCAARAAPAAVAALFATEPSSAAENAAFGAVVPALSGCIPAGVEMNMSPFEIRGFLAEGAYRFAVTQPNAGS